MAADHDLVLHTHVNENAEQARAGVDPEGNHAPPGEHGTGGPVINVEKGEIGGGWIEGAYRQRRRAGGSGRGCCLRASAAPYAGCNQAARCCCYHADGLAAADAICSNRADPK